MSNLIMPSFIAAANNCNIDKDKVLASRFGIKVSSYHAVGSNNPSPKEFNNLLTDFDKFCKENKNSTCDMLMLTGYHGEYGLNGILNNLSKQQLKQLVQTAQKYKVEFKHILSDSCCSAFGLKALEGMLANGGEAIGDRMTSTAYKMQDALIEKMSQANPQQPNAEQKLINDTIESTMNTFNAPLYITKDNQQIRSIGTKEAEVKHHVIETYRIQGVINEPDDVLAEAELKSMGLDQDFNFLPQDLQDSNKCFIIDEKNNRADLLTERKQHQAQQTNPAQVVGNQVPEQQTTSLLKLKSSLNTFSVGVGVAIAVAAVATTAYLVSKK